MLVEEEKVNQDMIRKMPTGTKRKSLKNVREEYEAMRMQRMEEQQKEAEEKMVQHWRINNPEYREVLKNIEYQL
jgi:ribosomal protein L22